MSRRREIPKREILPDPRSNVLTLCKSWHEVITYFLKALFNAFNMLTLAEIMHLKFIIRFLFFATELLNLIKDIFDVFKFLCLRFGFHFDFRELYHTIILGGLFRHEILAEEIECGDSIGNSFLLFIVKINIDIIDIEVYWSLWSYFLEVPDLEIKVHACSSQVTAETYALIIALIILIKAIIHHISVVIKAAQRW